jgi:hypothetical protein
VVTDAWKGALDGHSTSIHAALKVVAGGLLVRTKNVLGDLEKTRKKLRKELEICRRRGINGENIAREEILRYRLEKVEKQIDIYWRQRAHVRWLEKGDRNTSFFHAACSERRRSNRIGKLKKDDGRWVEEEEERRFITNYFYNIFRSNGAADTQQLTQAVECKVTNEMNDALIQEYNADEVKNALESIGDMKAPGPDGMPSIFYKRFWEVVGEKVTEEVLQVLNGGEFPWGGMRQLLC